MADLDEMREQVFGLYRRQDYERALELARSVADQFPANASYWIACRLAVTDRPDEALATLEQALERGAYWPPLMLTHDPDLEPIRDSERFARVVAESERNLDSRRYDDHFERNGLEMTFTSWRYPLAHYVGALEHAGLIDRTPQGTAPRPVEEAGPETRRTNPDCSSSCARSSPSRCR